MENQFGFVELSDITESIGTFIQQTKSRMFWCKGFFKKYAMLATPGTL